MLSRSKIGIVMVGAALVLAALICLWILSDSTAKVYLPDGSVVPFVPSQVKTVRWRDFPIPPPRQVPWTRRFVYAVIQLLGKGNFSVPNPPRKIDLLGNVLVFPEYTGKNYLVADELLAGGETNWISFTFGGPRNCGSQAEWVQANLDCIRTNGVVVSSMQAPYRPFSTTLCAVVVGPKTVRILPARHFDRQAGILEK